MQQDMIVILDLGSTDNTGVARMVRKIGVYSEIHPHDITVEELRKLPNVKGIIINGGENNVVDGQKIDICHEIYEAGWPVLSVGHEPAKGDIIMHQWPEDENESENILCEFVLGLCKAQANWNMENFIADQVELIREQVRDRKVLLALSGGVDSSVVAALLIKAIGRQLVCVHVNHGLMRKG
ncbi:MAG: glutamine amidotransferase-related protein, partial [Catenibacillus sp.]